MKNGNSDVAFRGHLPPPFYNGREDYARVEYLSEPRFVQAEDEMMTGRFAQKPGHRRPWKDTMQNPDYRHYGDRRWNGDQQAGWSAEQQYREGYRTMDEQMRLHAGNRGKGPRSYRRGDDRILEDLNERFYEDAFLDASDIETRVSVGEVFLTGTVEDREAKRRAEAIAEMISGVTHVENRLKVLTRLRDERPG